MATAQNKKLATAVAASISGPLLTLAFANGEALTVDSNMLSEDIRSAALMHGLKQKLVDAAAIARNPDTGATATIDDKYAAVREVYDRITSTDGTWNKERAANGGGASAKGGLLVRAMMRLTSKSNAEIVAFLGAKSKEELAALRKNPRIAEIIAQLQVETANTSDIDSDALLDSLMSGGGNDVLEAEETGDSDEQQEEGTTDDAAPASPVVPSFPTPTAAKVKKGNGAAKA